MTDIAALPCCPACGAVTYHGPGCTLKLRARLPLNAEDAAWAAELLASDRAADDAANAARLARTWAESHG